MNDLCLALPSTHSHKLAGNCQRMKKQSSRECANTKLARMVVVGRCEKAVENAGEFRTIDLR